MTWKLGWGAGEAENEGECSVKDTLLPVNFNKYWSSTCDVLGTFKELEDSSEAKTYLRGVHALLWAEWRWQSCSDLVNLFTQTLGWLKGYSSHC